MFYDRGSTLPLCFFCMTGFLNPKSSYCQPCSENDVFVYLSHGISHRDAIWVFAEVSFRVRYGAPYASSLSKFMVNLYRRMPHHIKYQRGSTTRASNHASFYGLAQLGQNGFYVSIKTNTICTAISQQYLL